MLKKALITGVTGQDGSYLAEFLLDTWIFHNDIQYQEVELRVLDGEKKVKKAIGMLKSKITGKKYERSY